MSYLMVKTLREGKIWLNIRAFQTAIFVKPKRDYSHLSFELRLARICRVKLYPSSNSTRVDAFGTSRGRQIFIEQWQTFIVPPFCCPSSGLAS